MINRTTKLRWRRRVRRGKRQVGDIGTQAEVKLEKHFFKRLGKFPHVARFAATWIVLIVLLICSLVVQIRVLAKHYLVNGPIPGGIYTEGILGSFTNSNPVYATSDVDSSVSKLVFSGLLRIDSNNRIVGDLAKSWQTDNSELIYTVTLKDNLTWQDGAPLTVDDVIFTYNIIQNPDAKSPLFSSWQGIKVTAKNKSQIVFKLPSALSSFPYSLTNGILPKHLLASVPPAQLRSVNFNTNPVGAGPFKWEDLQVTGDTKDSRQEQIGLLPFDNYANGKPKLSKFIIRAYHDETALKNSFDKKELNGAAGISKTPDDVKKDISVTEYNVPLFGEVMIFFRTTVPVLSDPGVRQALVRATNTGELIADLDYPVVAANEPLLRSQVGYDRRFGQLAYNPTLAAKMLDSAGWKIGSDGIRHKRNQALSFSLYTQTDTDFADIADIVKKQWREIGVDLQVVLEPAEVLKPKLVGHDYDALLYGIEIGTDPDVYAYWDSKQADARSVGRLNFSEYKSTKSDIALEAGRTRIDPKLRQIKYKPFLQEWRQDAPAVALYQPRFLYLTRGQVYNFKPTMFDQATDRYATVYNWMIREERKTID